MFDDLLQNVINGFPNLAGWVVFAYVMYTQNQRLLGELFDQIEALKQDVEDLKVGLKEQGAIQDNAEKPPWEVAS